MIVGTNGHVKPFRIPNNLHDCAFGRRGAFEWLALTEIHDRVDRLPYALGEPRVEFYVLTRRLNPVAWLREIAALRRNCDLCVDPRGRQRQK